MVFLHRLFYYRYACAIPDPDTNTVVITGGILTGNTVSVYSVQGWQEDLPPLNIGRYRHACAGYTSGGRRVRYEEDYLDLYFNFFKDVPC